MWRIWYLSSGLLHGRYRAQGLAPFFRLISAGGPSGPYRLVDGAEWFGDAGHSQPISVGDPSGRRDHIIGRNIADGTRRRRVVSARPKPAGRAFVFVAMIYGQMLLGALVAGVHAGIIYNTWPDMNGQVFPEDGFFLSPLWRNFFKIHPWSSSTTARAPMR